MKEENLNEEVEKILKKIDENLISYLKKNDISYRSAAQQSNTQYAELSRIGTREDRHAGLVLLLFSREVYELSYGNTDSLENPYAKPEYQQWSYGTYFTYWDNYDRKAASLSSALEWIP